MKSVKLLYFFFEDRSVYRCFSIVDGAVVRVNKYFYMHPSSAANIDISDIQTVNIYQIMQREKLKRKQKHYCLVSNKHFCKKLDKLNETCLLMLWKQLEKC